MPVIAKIKQLELIQEIGPDVIRYFFIMRSMNTHLDFDLNLAKDQSEKNPVFYLQYAYARINSLFLKSRPFFVVNASDPPNAFRPKAGFELIKSICFIAFSGTSSH